ncbi:MAG: DUF6152 family protein [Gammaproteobacteria bacterium]
MKRLMITCLVLAPGIASAHHFPANFDLEVTDFEVTGRIASVSFRNPHSVIQLLVEAADGTTSEWYVEFSSVNLLLRRGWDLDRVEAGDIVTRIGHSSANEAPEMYIRRRRLPGRDHLGAGFGTDRAVAGLHACSA